MPPHEKIEADREGPGTVRRWIRTLRGSKRKAVLRYLDRGIEYADIERICDVTSAVRRSEPNS